MPTKRIASRAQEDALQAYYAQIRRTPLLTAEEERELSRRIRGGDTQARSKLIESNLRLVVKIAKGFVSTDVSLLDLIQEGNLGLLKAAERFDDRKEVRFSTYAAWWIKQSITRALANRRRAIRLPHRKEEALRRIQRTYNALIQESGSRPSVATVAKELRMTEADVSEILQVATEPVSLHSSPTDGSGSIIDIIEDSSYAPDRIVMDDLVRSETHECIKELHAREQTVLKYRYALDGGERVTLKKISDELGVSPETVRQIELRAIKKLRQKAEYLKELVTA